MFNPSKILHLFLWRHSLRRFQPSVNMLTKNFGRFFVLLFLAHGVYANCRRVDRSTYNLDLFIKSVHKVIVTRFHLQRLDQAFHLASDDMPDGRFVLVLPSFVGMYSSHFNNSGVSKESISKESFTLALAISSNTCRPVITGTNTE